MACSTADDLWIVKPVKIDEVLGTTNAKGHHLKNICLFTRRAVYRADEFEFKISTITSNGVSPFIETQSCLGARHPNARRSALPTSNSYSVHIP